MLNLEHISGDEYPRSKELFIKTNQKIERLSEISFSIFLKVLLPFEILPKSIASFAAYFISHAGRDSFRMPMPFW